MNTEQQFVYNFHKFFNVHIEPHPKVPPTEVVELRIRLMLGELNELIDALRDKNLIEIADGIADLLYVAYGTAVSCGLNMQYILDEVHTSNMTKGGRRKDGKILKPITFRPPDLNGIFRLGLHRIKEK